MNKASRDGIHFYRWMEHPVISKSAPADRDKIRSNHLWQEMVELPDKPDKHSMYASENLGIKGPHEDGSLPRVRRFTIRKDGFVSVRVEILDIKQRPISGFTVDDSDPLSEDEIDATVTWRGHADIGKTIHLRLVLNDADVFSFQFTE